MEELRKYAKEYCKSLRVPTKEMIDFAENVFVNAAEWAFQQTKEQSTIALLYELVRRPQVEVYPALRVLMREDLLPIGFGSDYTKYIEEELVKVRNDYRNAISNLYHIFENNIELANPNNDEERMLYDDIITNIAKSGLYNDTKWWDLVKRWEERCRNTSTTE